MKYLVKVFENVYKDNWEEGEVFGSYQRCLMYQTETEDLKKAVKDFADRYLRHDKKLYITDNFIHIDFTAKNTTHEFVLPTEEDIEKWKKDEIDLWNVEYMMDITKIEEATTAEILDAVGKDINIEKD